MLNKLGSWKKLEKKKKELDNAWVRFVFVETAVHDINGIFTPF